MCSLVAVATAVRARATPTPGALGSKLFLDLYLETVQRDFVSCGILFLEPPPLVLLDVIGIPEHFTGGRVSPIDEPHGVSVGTRMLMLVRHNLEENSTAAVVLRYGSWLATTGVSACDVTPFINGSFGRLFTTHG